MSTRIYKSQTYRPYKIEVYGLQDNYIGTLQSYDDSFIGRVQDSQVSLSKDGTQKFTCSIPRFYINPKTNEKIINPRWEDINNGVLAENTRVLKVFVEIDNEKKVYPFIVDTIVDKRDSHFSVYKEVTGNGLAFAELGKTGLKLELNADTVKLEQEENKDKEIVPTLQYWLDKVFPNIKDPETGKVIKWLSPWCYEIRMDWSHYSDKENRETNKVYSDAYINSWEVKDGILAPTSISPYEEKARQINCSKNGNKYNITQTLAETYGVFCDYEYKCAENGSFIKEYTDENGNVWQGRKAIFYNRAIKTDNPFMMEYQKNLQSISRTCETSEIYSKLYVTPIESSKMTDGYVTIANTDANPLLDEFILNFDYLYEKGAINDYQKEYIAKYETEIHTLNKLLIEQSKIIEDLTVKINNKKAEEAGYEKSITSAKEELVHYETLRYNEVTNTPVVKDGSNSYSVIFVTSGETTEAKIRLEGVACGTISGYSDHKYETKLFDASNLVITREKRLITPNDTNVYVLVDEDGYAIGLYTAKNNLSKDETISSGGNAGYLVYLALEYSPYNKYIDVCKRFENLINKETQKKEEVALAIQEKQTILDEAIIKQTELLNKKQQLNQKLEKILGPALREGYWTPDGYDEIEKKSAINLKMNEKTENEEFFFDTELFETEEKGYYYGSKEDFANENPTYYNYIDISNYYSSWDKNSFGKLVVHLQNPSFKYVAQKDEALLAGNYFIILNTTKYYFTLEESLKKDDILEIKFSYNSGELQLYLIVNNEENILLTTDEEGFEDSSNVSVLFEGINQYLGDYKIYPNAGFIYSFIKINGNIKPVLLLNNTDINYDKYTQFAYSFEDNTSYAAFALSDIHYNEPFEICYPRIAIYKENVNYNSDTLYLKNITSEKQLTKFEDFSILVRNGWPYLTLKINNNISIGAVLQDQYNLQYPVSQANEILYQDAKEVAKENSRPRFSYDVQVSQIPGNIEHFELGQLGYISDPELGVHAAQGYISDIVLKLDSPKDDEITIQNYKTKFEDLFSTITASSEAMKQNQHSYDIAASGFTSQGELDGSILQNTFDNNKIELTYSNTNVTIDDLDGIVLTNTEPYANGVYGQVVLRGGGIFLSNRVDSNEERIWSTGITPNGINASTITTGQLDANLIRIFAGNNLAFQWNSEGIYAYRRDEETNEYLPNTYVHYSDKGLQYLDNGFVAVDLGWNGLAINSQEGALSLTGKDGLILYEGKKNTHGTNHVVKLGRFGENEDDYSYGMRLYKKTEETDEDGCHIYTETLTTTNDGQLWLKDYIEVGTQGINTNTSGISGVTDDSDVLYGGDADLEILEQDLNGGTAGISGNVGQAVRFWAGTTFEERENAPFRVLADGSVFATSLYIGNDSTIGGTSVKDILDNTSMCEVKVESSNGLVYNTSTEQETTLTARLYKNNLNLMGLPDNITLENLRYEVSENSGEWEPLLEGNNFPFYGDKITMDTSKKYRVCFSYSIEERSYTIYSEEVVFTAVSNGKDGENGKDGAQGPAGDAGKDAKVYRLISSANSITRDLTILSPTQITIQIGVNEGGVNSVLSDIGSFDLVVSCQQNNSVSIAPEGITVVKQDNQWVIEISKEKYGYGSLVEAINFTLSLDGVNILTQSIPFILGSQLQDLAKVEKDAVYIDGGKIYANSVTANAIAAYTITADKIAANTITTDKIAADFDLEIGAGRSINITTDGTFTVASDNFTITDKGDVSLTGNIKAESGSIGGWSIDEYGLYSGEGATRVSLNSNGEGENANYAIWAGANEPQTTTIVDGKEVTTYAPFSVTRDGRVYLTKIMALASETDTTPTVVDLSSNYWQIWTGYSHSVKDLKVQNDTLTIELYNGTKVNFNKAAVNSQNYMILFGGSGVNLTAQLYKNGSTPVPISGVYSSASLVLEKDANGSYANGKVVVSTKNGASGAPLPEISVAEVYRSGVNSVTINSATPSSYAWGATGPNRYYTEIVFTVILTNGIKRTYTIPVTHTLS